MAPRDGLDKSDGIRFGTPQAARRARARDGASQPST